jgi:hypothetical protein
MERLAANEGKSVKSQAALHEKTLTNDSDRCFFLERLFGFGWRCFAGIITA